MANLKKYIAILIIILIFTISIIGFVIYKNKGKIIYGIDEEYQENTYNFEGTIQNVLVRNDYYSVRTCINKFYLYYSSIFNIQDDYLIIDDEAKASIDNQKSQSIEAVYNMLDDEYKSYKDIAIENLETKLPKIEKRSVNINKMYVSEKDQNISVYFAYGKLTNTATWESNDFSIMVKVDKLNQTFTILLGDYISDKYENVNIGDNIEINYPKKIENKQHNKFNYEIISDETYITDVFNSFRDNMIYNKQVAYECLDEEYRTKRFSTFEEFEKYTKNNIRKISIMKLSKFKKSQNDGITQYICIDSKDKYYIINEQSTMNCTFILDTYTLDLPQFIEKYNESDNTTKVALNLEKIKDAINEKDFMYVSNKTDETFRKNNFKNYSEFENYLKSKFFEENDFEYEKVEQQSNVYIATVIIKNAKNEQETRQMKVVMKLTDTTDYTISFSFK